MSSVDNIVSDQSDSLKKLKEDVRWSPEFAAAQAGWQEVFEEGRLPLDEVWPEEFARHPCPANSSEPAPHLPPCREGRDACDGRCITDRNGLQGEEQCLILVAAERLPPPEGKVPVSKPVVCRRLRSVIVDLMDFASR